MDYNKIENLLDKIQRKFKIENNREFRPYIKQIRFPKYKGLVLGTEINFSFPLTVLVGVNEIIKRQFYKLFLEQFMVKV